MELDTLTPKELLHFALHASKNKRSDSAILYLKHLIEIQPENLDGLFLLGSEYAEIEMYDEGIVFMEKALEISPDAHLVRYQMSMLQLTLNQNEKAIENLQPLTDIEDSNIFFHYAKGLIAINDKDIEQAKSHIQSGLELQNDNIPLKENMTNLLARLSSTEAENITDNPETTDSSSKLFLSVYDS